MKIVVNHIKWIQILCISMLFMSCNPGSKQKEAGASDTIAIAKEDATIPPDEEEVYGEDALSEEREKYIDLVTTYMNISEGDYIPSFCDARTLSDKKRTAVLIPVFASGKRDVNDQYSLCLRLFILDNESKEVVSQSDEDIILVSDALAIGNLNLDVSPLELVPGMAAFSVEVMKGTMGRSSPYSETSVYLFIQENNKIRNIVSDYPTYSEATQWINESSVENMTVNTHFSVSPEEPSGVFRDIIATSDTIVEKRELDIDKDRVTTRNAEGKKVLKYQNGKYS